MLPPLIAVTDYHTGGEPFRIVPAGTVPLPGDTVAERRARAVGDTAADELRRFLCFEPRGHADMYGGLITAPDDDGAAFGVLFWHKDGFSTACGHGTIALGAWAVDAGVIAAPDDGTVDVVIDVPSGRVTARVHRGDGRTVGVDFLSVPSYCVARDVEVETSSGPLRVDVGYGGAFYAHLDAAQLGIPVRPDRIESLRALGREVKWLLDSTPYARHPFDSRLDGMYGTVVYESVPPGPGESVHQRNVTIFADGEVDRSPCGSGTASRTAVLSARGQLADDELFVNDSIIGSRFLARARSTEPIDGRPAVLPVISGTAFPVGRAEYVVDLADELLSGFLVR